MLSVWIPVVRPIGYSQQQSGELSPDPKTAILGSMPGNRPLKKSRKKKYEKKEVVVGAGQLARMTVIVWGE